MTALINTRSGGKTEARIGDVCTYYCQHETKWIDFAIHTIDSEPTPITPNGLLSYLDATSSKCGVSPDICTLISRPTFQVGDEVEYLQNGKDWVKKEFRLRDFERISQADKLRGLYRHANPDWREPV